ncbi:MAG: L-seryl-tRNA(Sec) selenium transferase, partial [Gammaproteobacteria bacterium]|nr:L-seryl-tRNA(Sec) selenium transferase [Gammaproteobacteria bacterium]
MPSVEQLLQREDVRALVDAHGHGPVRDALRAVMATLRSAITARGADALTSDVAAALVADAATVLAAQSRSTHRPVFNLTGTVLHTNLGRAVLPEVAVDALVQAARFPTTVEFDLATGQRGDRDTHVESLLRELTGAESATIVNNNAAAVLLCLNSLAQGREVPVSRGELIEIGGAFRMPDIMSRAGCNLVEVGTTNRTHLFDFERAITDQTAALMTVHTSNYVVQGFTAAVPESELAALAHQHDLPFIDDLGSGTLVDLEQFGLPHEPTPRETLEAGADVVTFSGDKLLGGPQCGIIVGRRDLIATIKRNPMKRALRVDKLKLAALEAVLRLYKTPEKLAQHLPAVRQLSRAKSDIGRTAEAVREVFAKHLSGAADIRLKDCMSQIGSGALPVDTLPSVAIAITPHALDGHVGTALTRWVRALRELPMP